MADALRVSARAALDDPFAQLTGPLAAEAAEVELPPGRGHAYLLGEATVVSRLREVLAGRGLGQDQISPKAYWGRGRANASHGEPARDA
jgi:NADPH-dependent ferric siderophore reductase